MTGSMNNKIYPRLEKELHLALGLLVAHEPPNFAPTHRRVRHRTQRRRYQVHQRRLTLARHHVHVARRRETRGVP